MYKCWERRRREPSITFDGGATPHDGDGALTHHAASGRVKGFTGSWLIGSWWLTKAEKMHTGHMHGYHGDSTNLDNTHLRFQTIFVHRY